MRGYGHQEVPYEKVVEAVGVERNTSQAALVQVTLTLQNTRVEELKLGELRVRGEEMEKAALEYDLSLIMGGEGSGRGMLVYNRDIFEAETVRRLARQYERVMEAMSGDWRQRVIELELLSEEEREEVLWKWNERRREYEGEAGIGERFEAAAAARWEAVAVVEGDEQVSYGELERRGNRLGNYLLGMGVGPEVRVGVSLRRGVKQVEAVLGIVKAGGVYVPLEEESPGERQGLIVEEAGIAVVVTAGEEKSAMGVHGLAEVDVEEEAEAAAIRASSAARPGVKVGGESLAYVIYTSGSTGKPKGVSVTHRGVLRLVCNNDYAELNSQQVIMHGSNVAFDAATFEVWGALLNGGRLVVSRERVASAAALRRQIEEGGVKTMWLTASLYNAVAEEGLEQLRGLEQVLIGGEALSVRHVRAGVEKLEGTRLINGYGPTEATTFSCCHEIGEADVRAGRARVMIGRAIANTEVYVLGRQMEAVAVGMMGELYIGGDGLARGYLGKAEQTAERFVPHPYSQQAGARLYRSGDLCRWNWQGKVEYIGRADQQVKVRGYRIELGEIEAALAGCAGVKQAAVEVKLEGGDKRLVGYVVGREGETLSPRQLREQLRGKLPDYMVPGWIEVMAAMPLTVGGKLDRRRLRQREVEAGQREVGSRRAATPIEEVVSGIYGAE